MSELLHELVLRSTEHTPDALALRYKNDDLSYSHLSQELRRFASGLIEQGLDPRDRVAVYLPKCFEAVIAFFATAAAGGVFVPVNPLLKAEQTAHILRDSGARFLITSAERLPQLSEVLTQCHDLHRIIVTGSHEPGSRSDHAEAVSWETLRCTDAAQRPHRTIDTDMVAILYTSGSTGRPKGVVLSHRNMVSGAKSVAQYLENRSDDRLLAALPFSFDYGFSQLSTAFWTGASVVLLDYLLPRDVVLAVERDGITGLAAVPPLWIQLAEQKWPDAAVESLRYITNSGGAMPRVTVDSLVRALPKTQVYLMYGLTEAFRSTYLPPQELSNRPDSMGKAIPNADIQVVRDDGSRCAPGEPGELVHRGSLVSMGYWNDPAKTAERFRPAPGVDSRLPLSEIAVWSGDTVRIDEEGYLYFVGRKDEMIKTSGYRVSPTEVEEIIYQSGYVLEAAAVGVPHPVLGQAIVAVVAPKNDPEFDEEAMLATCRQRLPAFMVPAQVIRMSSLPRNPNGKIDRKQLAGSLEGTFQESSE